MTFLFITAAACVATAFALLLAFRLFAGPRPVAVRIRTKEKAAPVSRSGPSR
jgi:hypothetical protein